MTGEPSTDNEVGVALLAELMGDIRTLRKVVGAALGVRELRRRRRDQGAVDG